jgi:hypothetical protein
MIAVINRPLTPTLSPRMGGEGVDWAAGFCDETGIGSIFFSLSPMGERVG